MLVTATTIVYWAWKKNVKAIKTKQIHCWIADKRQATECVHFNQLDHSSDECTAGIALFSLFTVSEE